MSIGVLLAACGDAAGTGTSTNSGAAGTTGQDSAARNAFLADRSGTPDPNATPLPGAVGGNGRFGGRGPGEFGTVKSIDGNKITITSMATNTDVVIQASDTTTVTKEITGTVADITIGETITAIGQTSGDTVDATRVQIGGGFGGFGGFGGRGGGGNFPGAGGQGVFSGTRTIPSGTPGAGFNGNGFPGASGTPGANRGNFGGAGGTFVNGTVEKIDGDVVTVKTTDGGTATFTLSANSTIMKQERLKVSDIAVGNTITATGQMNGSVFDATSIQLTQGFNGNVQAPPAP